MTEENAVAVDSDGVPLITDTTGMDWLSSTPRAIFAAFPFSSSQRDVRKAVEPRLVVLQITKPLKLEVRFVPVFFLSGTTAPSAI